MRTLRLAGMTALTALALSACGTEIEPLAAVGDCVDLTSVGVVVDSLPIVPCEEPHDAEVFAVFDLGLEGEYNEDTVYDAATVECEVHFEDFVGVNYWDSEIFLQLTHPLAEGWDQGDREVTCLALEVDAQTGDIVQVTGTLAGANR